MIVLTCTGCVQCMYLSANDNVQLFYFVTARVIVFILDYKFTLCFNTLTFGLSQSVVDIFQVWQFLNPIIIGLNSQRNYI